MRSLCFALILVNILYFTWAQFIDGPFEFASPVSAAQVHSIQLASEAPRTLPPLEPPPSAPVSITEIAADCVSVGPFLNVAEANQAISTLTAAGFRSSQRVEQGELFSGFWVHVPGLAAPGAADTAIRQLHDRGVADVFLLPGEGSPVLSLGVFVDRERAERRAEAARSLGLDVKIVDRKRTGSVYWVDALPNTSGQKVDAAMFPPEPGKIARVELRACKA